MNGATVINSHCMKFFFPSAPLCLVSHQNHFFLLSLMSRLNSLRVSLIHLYRFVSSHLWSVYSLLVSFTWLCFYILSFQPPGVYSPFGKGWGTCFVPFFFSLMTHTGRVASQRQQDSSHVLNGQSM